jgi:DNA excision repair protein ERCC-3
VTELTLADFHDAVEAAGEPVLTARAVADALGIPQAEADEGLSALADAGRLDRREIGGIPVFYPTDWASQQARERVVSFPGRRAVIADQPTQATRARLSQVAHLAGVNGEGGYRYEFRAEDVWAAPFDSLEAFLSAVRTVLPERDEGLDNWLEDQWRRARQFKLTTHDEGYDVLVAASAELMGNVATAKLDDGVLRAEMSETEAWVNDERIAELKRTLYDAGYPVQDERDLSEGDRLDAELKLPLRNYQERWVERFVERGSGVMVGPPGSGKTVAAMAALTAIGGEALVLVPGRQLATQWREELLAQTTLDSEQVGLYHGGVKEVRPVTVGTYQTVGMDRHRHLFDDRRWGLVVFDECQHVPAPVFKRTTAIQGKHRLGLTATPVREDGNEKEIYSLIGPPIGTDWDALFDAGYVEQPEVELRFVPWDERVENEEYAAAVGVEKRQLAATNPAKDAEVEALLDDSEGKALVFVEYLEQGERLAKRLDVPFISGETRHAERARRFDAFRRGELDTLVVSRVGDEGIDLPDAEIAVVASGLGGSRRQGAQRAGRTMRPGGDARMYVLATRGTREEEFARRQVTHLAAKGIPVTENTVGTVGDGTDAKGEHEGEEREGESEEGEAGNDGGADAPAE